MDTTLNRIIRYGLLANVGLTVLMHGAVDAWAIALFELFSILLFSVWLLGRIFTRNAEIMLPATLWPLVGLFLLGAAQSVRWPGANGQMNGLSWDTEATRLTLLLLFCLILNFILAANLLSERAALPKLVNGLMIYGVVLALFGVIQYFTSNGKMYWVQEMPVPINALSGPFVNRNHFAGYLELLVTLPAALVLLQVVKREARVFYGFLTVVMGVAIVVSLSRGGMISLLAGLLLLATLGLLELRRRLSPRAVRQSVSQAATSSERPHLAVRGAGAGRGRFALLTSGIAAGLLLLTIVVGVFWVAADPVINRVTTGSSAGDQTTGPDFYNNRGWIWQATGRLIAANPLLGTGLGSFMTAYPHYSLADPAAALVETVHNDYLQLLADCGVVGGLLLVWFVGVLLRRVRWALHGADQWTAAAVLGMITGIGALAVHSLFDFNLQLPSHSLLLLVYVAILSVIGETAHASTTAHRPA